MAVEVRIKMTPKQAGALYMKHETLKAKYESLRKAVCLVCVEELFDSEDCENDNECIDNFLKYAKGFE